MRSNRVVRAGSRRHGRGAVLLQACVLALGLSLSLQVRAEERAVKSRISPVYPEIAKRMRVTGVVRVVVTVDPDGKVKDVTTVSGNHMLATAAEEAVRKLRFASAPGQTTVNLDINFALGQ